MKKTIVTLIACLAALAVPSTADAGTYKAIQCYERSGAGYADAAFTNSSDRYRKSADCEGSGLGITHAPGSGKTGSGRYGAWTITAPDGTEMTRAAARVSAKSQNWHVPRLLIDLEGGSRDLLEGVRGDLHTVDWEGNGGRSISGRLVCTNRDECGDGRDAHLEMRRISLTLDDLAEPKLELGGSLVQDGSRRGREVLDVSVTDAGSGVRNVTVDLNGSTLEARVLECHLKDGVAIRVRPCPASPTPKFEIDTTAAGFRQGPNQLRVCAADYAPEASANRTCQTQVIRVDNECPVSSVPAASLHARFKGAGSKISGPSDAPVKVLGRVEDENGSPVSGAEVCVATRIEGSDGPPERVLATPTTGPNGQFKYRIPAGPNREVRIAHWSDPRTVVEKFLAINSRVVPRLSISPDRTLANGDRARFQVHLPGPAQGKRAVSIQARANGKWIRIAGGRTSRGGGWTGSYRFTSTTGTRHYAFRAVVSRQPGYPYAPGKSKVRKVTVVGS